MSELAGFGVLPARVARQVAHEEAAERVEARRAAEQLEVAAEAWRERNAELFRSQAELRGQDVSVMELVQGGGGRALGDVLEAARGDLARDYAAQAPVDERLYSEPSHGAVARSSWPGSEYELDGMIERASGLHRDLQAARARRDYPAAVEAARAKSEPYVQRSGGYGGSGYVQRACDAGFAVR